MSADKKKINKNKKIIFVVGGVMSGIGKGVAMGVMASLIKNRGYRVGLMKVDPYLNIDAGTMHPIEHGEVFVLDDGLECDQDMGNYERFLDQSFNKNDYVTSGYIYQSVLNKERSLKYDGKCVEAIPHITNEIQNFFIKSINDSDIDVQFIEIGGTIGDFQNTLFYEAIRGIKGKQNFDIFVCVVLPFPVPGHLGEMKTRPAQNAIRQLLSFGISPDFILARGEKELDDKRINKLADNFALDKNYIFSAPDMDSVYKACVYFKEKQKLDAVLLKKIGLKVKKVSKKNDWEKFVELSEKAKIKLSVAIAGKYFDSDRYILSDAYHSVINALKFSAVWEGVKLDIDYINTKDFDTNKVKLISLKKYDAIIVPGGFGGTGISGKLKIIKYVRENDIPYLGICYGAQLAVIEFARNILGLSDANSTENDTKTKNPIVSILSTQKAKMERMEFGGTMRLGAKKILINKNTKTSKIYNNIKTVSERHRHRYFINTDYKDKLEKNGMIVSAKALDTDGSEIIEIIELKNHSYFVATQFHPEFLARPFKPHPLFTGLLKAAILKLKKN